MATIVLNWTPAGGANVTGQLVQRRTESGSFSTIATVSGTTNTYSDSTAADNTVYYYRIVTECEVGGPSNSTAVQTAKLVCPEIAISYEGADVVFDLPALSGDAIYDTITILDGATIVATNTIGNPGPMITSFTLTAGETYNYAIVINAGNQSLECSGEITIPVTPTCPNVTGLTATVS